jgi:hypothetical protein
VPGGSSRDGRGRRRRRWSAAPIRRGGPGLIDLDLPEPLAGFVELVADRVRRSADQPGSPGFDRLYGEVEVGAARQDPLVMLRRQTTVDGLCAVVASSCRKPAISDEEGEAWMRVLGMASALRAAELGLSTDGDRDALTQHDEAYFGAIQALQLWLIEALDGPS